MASIDLEAPAKKPKSMYLPITLIGDNLGKRHHQLNSLVNDAYQKNIALASILELPEKSAIDRLFKIDLAAKYKDVDYFIQTLKDQDMLFVSRALKSKWMLDKEYCHIVNPVYLEDVLYPELITSAITKVKHWIELNLKDSNRCEAFYQYYKEKQFHTAFKFLSNCSKEFIKTEVSNVMEKLTPFKLKLLTEKCTDVAKIFFESIQNNDVVLSNYVDDEQKYYDSLRFLLKVDADIFLDITEKYFSRYNFERFSAEATKYIMKNHKDRFNSKPELYTSWLLDVKTLAKYLSNEEIKDIILKLARSEYDQSWFSYKSVEPLIKSLSVEQRSAFKKQVFVDKNVGDKVEKWPYETPSSPSKKYTGANVFEETVHDPYEYEYLVDPESDVLRSGFKRCLMKRKCSAGAYMMCEMVSAPCFTPCVKRKTSLDRLFDRFRFVSFEKTFYDLRKQMAAESAQHRQNSMLVLVSKSGGRVESVEQLLKLLTTRYMNEPENIRATIIRSLVKRSNAWRLPQNVWDLMLSFSQGLGLDGKPSMVACREGLHAVVIRNIIHNQEIDKAVWEKFLGEFSTFTEYSLNAAEKQKLSTKLPMLLLASAEKDASKATDQLEKALNTLEAYKIRIEKSSDLVTAIALAAKKNPSAVTLLRRLYDARIARKELFVENFAMIQTEASYLNALRHDATILTSTEKFDGIIKAKEVAHDRFLRTVSLYFNEDGGLAEQYLALFKNHIEETPQNKLARSIAILSGDTILEMISTFDNNPKKSEKRRFAAALKANAHLARPLIDLDTFGWRKIGAKAISNRVLICSSMSVDSNVQKLLVWSKTQRLAFVLSKRVEKEVNVLSVLGEKRPRFTLKITLWHLKRNKIDEGVWDIIIPLIPKLNTSGKIKNRNDTLRKLLFEVDKVPDSKKVDYCIKVYDVIKNVSKYARMPMLCHIENLLPTTVADEIIVTAIKQFLNEMFIPEKWDDKNHSYDVCVCLHLRIIAKYLVFCTSEAEQQRRWENVGELFFDHCDEKWKNWRDKPELMVYFEDFLESLKCTKAFLDTKYVSCLPAIEKIINRLQNIFPIHEYYDKYIQAHLTMLYFKSVRQAVKNNPNIFEDLPKNLDKAAEIVGRIFGKYIAHEVVELMAKHYDSIRDIYKSELYCYLRDHFQNGDSRNVLVTNVARGILDCDNGKAHLLAEYIYSRDIKTFPETIRKNVFQLLNESENLEVKMFLSSRKR